MPSHHLDVPNHPQDPEFGRREITISSQIFIERDDFVFKQEKNMKKFSPNGRVRLLNGYVIECQEVITDINGEVIELQCSYLSETLGGKKPNDGIKPNCIIHWVDANNCLNAEVRIYDRLFNDENPANADRIEDVLNPNSLQVIKNAKVERSLENVKVEERFQFNRVGYFIADLKDCSQHKLVFNRIVTLRN